jgi:1,2-diacylglycerol 3-beta-galactosyltransferase
VKRLLFLIADTGGGHRAAANAVSRYLAANAAGEFEVRIVDPFATATPRIVNQTAHLYGPLTRHARWLWGGLYHATNSLPAMSLLERSLLRMVSPGMKRLLSTFDPDVVVSFHPLLNHIAVRLARRGLRRVPVVTVITDLVDVHASWACADVDAVVVPSPGGFERCRRAGIPASRCHAIGLAVDAPFAAEPLDAEQRVVLRSRLGISPDAFVVLVCGGADGSGGIDRRAMALAAAHVDVELVVVCGRNHAARQRLEGLVDHAGRPVIVRGFVDNMADWMRAADVVATKAGPGTIAEALCCGLPMLLTSYLPGQERGNLEWLVDVGAGRYVPRVRQLVDAVVELSAPGSATLAEMKVAVRREARPDATRRIASLIADMAAGRIAE